MPSAAMYACIDVGSNTTRLLVASPSEGRLKEICQQRAFTRLSRGLREGEDIASKKLAEVASVVTTQVRVAREVGVEHLRAVATAAIRQASNGPALVEAIRDAAGVEITVLEADEEARLAFMGATKTLGHPVEGDVAVADVGGGSSELAVGSVEGGVSWAHSFRMGSGMLADSYLRSDPPAIGELHAVREHVAGVLEGLEFPRARLGVAVGGSASSLRRLVGAELAHETLERGIRVLASAPVAEVARRFELDPERVRLLPAGILALEGLSDRLGLPLQIGRGGVREGVILELIAANVSPSR